MVLSVEVLDFEEAAFFPTHSCAAMSAPVDLTTTERGEEVVVGLRAVSMC